MQSPSVYHSATTFLNDVHHDLVRRERDYNVILPLLLKPANDPSNLWIVDRTGSTLDFVLSCTIGSMGAYPVFIVPARPLHSMSNEFIRERVTTLVRRLARSLPSSRRVFSVFAPSTITRIFADEWHALTGHTIIDEPYYHARFCSVTRNTLRSELPIRTGTPSYTLRKAVSSDELGVAALCHEFASTSHPFVLDHEGALHEARLLISQGQVYVCDLGAGQIASIVAVTRSSPTNATITKVVTHPSFTRQGWAKRLVRYVCSRMLNEEHKMHVTLYVAHENISAQKAYHSVGFSGLFDNPIDTDIDQDWLELGFDNTDVGHW
ncbi:hypothetical protein FRB99_005188 [Tulasnella sp. 403]|nr:hypothetical protein FRB99_005188 [Tulasnella sp. 403]